MKGNFHVRFLGEGVAAMSLSYPTVRFQEISDAPSYDWLPIAGYRLIIDTLEFQPPVSNHAAGL